MSIKSLLKDVLSPEKIPASLVSDYSDNLIESGITKCRHEPISSDFCFCNGNESIDVLHLGQNCLHQFDNAGEHTSSWCCKNTLFFIFARILPIVRSEMPVKYYTKQNNSAYLYNHLPVAFATFEVQFTTRRDFWASHSK